MQISKELIAKEQRDEDQWLLLEATEHDGQAPVLSDMGGRFVAAARVVDVDHMTVVEATKCIEPLGERLIRPSCGAVAVKKIFCPAMKHVPARPDRIQLRGVDAAALTTIPVKLRSATAFSTGYV